MSASAFLSDSLYPSRVVILTTLVQQPSHIMILPSFAECIMCLSLRQPTPDIAAMRAIRPDSTTGLVGEPYGDAIVVAVVADADDGSRRGVHCFGVGCRSDSDPVHVDSLKVADHRSNR